MPIFSACKKCREQGISAASKPIKSTPLNGSTVQWSRAHYKPHQTNLYIKCVVLTVMTSARIDALLHRIRHANMRKIQSNQCSSLPSIVAFSGGVDSSLVASLVHRVFPLESAAVLGISPAVSIDQVERARTIANETGIQLVECNTTEGEDKNYVENRGRRLRTLHIAVSEM